jgi:hypothetical protein
MSGSRLQLLCQAIGIVCAGVAVARDLPRMRATTVTAVSVRHLGAIGPRVWVGRVDTGMPRGPSGIAQGTITRVLFQPGWVIGEGSSLDLVSVLDGATQHLSAQGLAGWSGMSAAFNGSQVDVFVNTSGPDDPTSFSIGSCLIYDGAVATTRSICGNDDRAASSDPAAARLSLVCSSFLLNTGWFVSAGHCGVVGSDFVEFNVPASWLDGTPQAASPSDQYPVQGATITAGQGTENWAIFRVGTNSNTGRTPREAQGAAYYVGYERGIEVGGSVPNARVTGFGIDTSPPGARGDRNSASQTQQTNVGSLIRPSAPDDPYLEADTNAGSAGSPIARDGTNRAWALATFGVAVADARCGTFFQTLWAGGINAALGTFPAGMIIVDGTYSGSVQSGTLQTPFRLFSQGANAVPVGGRIGILPTPQAYIGNITISRACTLSAPSGPVTIGR